MHLCCTSLQPIKRARHSISLRVVSLSISQVWAVLHQVLDVAEQCWHNAHEHEAAYSHTLDVHGQISGEHSSHCQALYQRLGVISCTAAQPSNICTYV